MNLQQIQNDAELKEYPIVWFALWYTTKDESEKIEALNQLTRLGVKVEVLNDAK